MASLAPPMPQEVAGQASPEAAQSVFAQQGLDQGNNPQGMEALQKLLQHVQGLDQWAQQAKMMLDQYDPSLATLLQPIAQAGLDLAKALQEKAQRSGMARGSPVVPPTGPPNPAAGPPQPQGM